MSQKKNYGIQRYIPIISPRISLYQFISLPTYQSSYPSIYLSFLCHTSPNMTSGLLQCHIGRSTLGTHLINFAFFFYWKSPCASDSYFALRIFYVFVIFFFSSQMALKGRYDFRKLMLGRYSWGSIMTGGFLGT